MKAPSLTLGIEEEYQIIDPESRELRSYITEILSGDSLFLDEVKPELHQSMVEIGSKVCKTPHAPYGEPRRPRAGICLRWPQAKRNLTALIGRISYQNFDDEGRRRWFRPYGVFERSQFSRDHH